MRSPLPESRNVSLASHTSSIASSRRRMRSVRQSFASSTADRSRLPRSCSSFDSKRANRANESAADPANPARIRSLYSRRILRADCLTTRSPKVTWPSPAMTVFPWCRTARTVVAWKDMAGSRKTRVYRPPPAVSTNRRRPGRRHETRTGALWMGQAARPGRAWNPLISRGFGATVCLRRWQRCCYRILPVRTRPDVPAPPRRQDPARGTARNSGGQP